MKCLVAGGCGMIGSNVSRILQEQNHTVGIADLKNYFDLREARYCDEAVAGQERIFHLSDRTVGLGYSSTHHGEMMTDSLLISLNLLKAAQKEGVKDYLYVSSSCVYSDGWDIPVRESLSFSGVPEEANFGYGEAKRSAELQCQFYVSEYKMRCVIVRPANIYGPSYDWSRPVEEMHVIPSLICKMLRGDDEITVWGSGKQTRTFDYESECAEKMVSLMEYGKSGEAYNLGGYEVTIELLAFLIAKLSDYKGEINFDTSKPEGPTRKAQNIEKLEATIPPWHIGSLEENLNKTIDAARKVFA